MRGQNPFVTLMSHACKLAIKARELDVRVQYPTARLMLVTRHKYK
jgi:hypothetical protein